jgi:hypothetical protein
MKSIADSFAYMLLRDFWIGFVKGCSHLPGALPAWTWAILALHKPDCREYHIFSLWILGRGIILCVIRIFNCIYFYSKILYRKVVFD